MRRGRVPHFVALALAAAWVGACSLTLSGTGDVDGDDGGGDAPVDTLASDARSIGDAGGEGSADGAPEASSPDAAPSDSGVNLLLGVRCASIDAFFCDDFDDASDDGWSSGAYGIGSVAIESDGQATSSPGALVAYGQATGTSPSQQYFDRNFPMMNPMRATLEFDLYIEQAGTYDAYTAFIGFIGVGVMDAKYQVQLVLRPPDVVVLSEDWQKAGAVEQSEEKACKGLSLPAGAWTHVALSADLTGAPASHSESVSINGSDPCTHDLTDDQLAPMWTARLALGLPWLDPKDSGAWQVRQDSVVFSLQ